MRKIVALSLCIICLSSCRMFDRLFRDDVVARVGNEVLYRKDIEALNIKGYSPEDSARIVSRYISSWAKNRLLLDLAESRLSKEEKDVEAQLEEYRQQLLVYRYEKTYVEQRLDTVISEEEYASFYEDNPKSFTASVPYFKGVFIKISENSPNASVVKSLYAKPDDASREKLKELAYVSAEKSFFLDEWTSLDFVSDESGIDMSDIAYAIENRGRMYLERMGYSYLLYADEYVPTGSVIPYEAAKERIKEVILSRRKQELLATLERNLLNDAINANKFIIYDDE